MKTKQKTAAKGIAKLQWNAEGWWGASLGATGWMVIIFLFLVLSGQRVLSLVPILTFLFNALFSLQIWLRRDRIKPYVGMMLLLAWLAFAVPFVWFFVEFNANPKTLLAMNWPTSIFVKLSVILLVPAIMVKFSVDEFSNRMPLSD